MSRKLLALVCLASLPVQSWAGWNFRHNAEVSPQYRNLNQEGVASVDEVYEAFGMLNTHAEWSSTNWFAEAKPEIRALASRGVKDTAPLAASVETSRRVLNSRRTIIRNEDGEAYFDFDRLNVRHTFTNGEAFVGRKPVSLGVLRFFPVWNKLTLPLIFQPGPEWVENPDVIGASYQLGNISYRAFAARGNEPKRDDIVLAESRWFAKGFELQMIAGHWWEHTAAGLSAAVDAFGSTLRLEFLWIARFKDEPSQSQIGLGVERALTEKWTLVAEALYQSAGRSEFQNQLTTPNRFMVLGGKFYALPYLTYQMNALWTLHAGGLINFADDISYVALGGFERSLNDNTSLTLKLKIPLGSDEGEFGAERMRTPFGQTAGMATTALLQLQTTF